MAETILNQFLQGDLKNGVYDEVINLTDFLQSYYYVFEKVRLSSSDMMYQLIVNFQMLKRQFSTFIMYYKTNCGTITSNRELERNFGELMMDGRLSDMVAKTRFDNNTKLLKAMLDFYHITIDIEAIINRLDLDRSVRIIDMILDTATYEKVKEVIEEEVVMKELTLKFEDEVNLVVKWDDRYSRLRSLAQNVEIKDAVVKVEPNTIPYCRIDYVYEYLPSVIRIKSNIRVFHVTSLMSSIFSDGLILRDRIEAFETMLVYYANGFATLDSKMVLTRTSTSTPVGSNDRISHSATYADLNRRPKGKQLWDYYVTLIKCSLMTELIARASFERDVFLVLRRLGFIDDLSDNINTNLRLYQASDEVTDMMIMDVTDRLDFSYMWSAETFKIRDCNRNLISTLMLRVAGSKKRITDSETRTERNIYMLFPVSSYGPSGTLRLDLRYANFVLRAILLSLA